MKILFIAGESSGDQHGADLIKNIKSQTSDTLHFFGIGGDKMAAEGVVLFYHINQMAFLGFSEVIRHLPFIFKVFKKLKKWIKLEKPAAIVLIDYPGFNLKFAKIAHESNIPVIYYICPQLWAWGEKRVEKIRKYVDLPLIIFEFEEIFYQNRGITARFVGHPMVDQIKITESEQSFRSKLGLDTKKELIALLPGSRINEIKQILPVILEAIKQFENRNNYYWIIGQASHLVTDFYQEYLINFPEIFTIKEDIYHLIKYSKVVLVASGTATLETGFIGTPMIVMYKVSPFSYFIGKKLVKVKDLAMVNIVSKERVVPELIQQDLIPKNLIYQLNKYLNQAAYYEEVKSKLSRIPNILGGPGASLRAAQEILSLIHIN